jgi:LuxR family maltose regulon positive regulatory protein
VNDNLLLTKLYVPPPNPRVVERPRLLEGLNEGLTRGSKLTLLSAPVGYGKSTLVSSWLAGTDCLAAWLSLDSEDNDPRQFWIYVIAALQTVHPDLGQTSLAMLQTAQMPSIEGLLGDLINQITTLSGKMILVLDDFHLLETTGLHQGFNFFLAHLPPQMHLVIITREDPPLPLPQMRAKGQMVELRANDLRFSMEESAHFLNHKMGLNLQPEEITALSQRTEGWAAGLQMAALSLHELDDPATFIEAFAGDNRYVADYLISEVLDRQPESIRDFLLQTAIVDRFTPSLCDVLIGDESLSSTNIIEQIEALGLFIMPLDHVRQWYRYHQLFADLLRYRIKQEDPSKFMELNRTASRWYQGQGLIEEAVKYALIGEDHDLVTELIETSGLAMIGQSQLVALHNWINALPDETIREHPYLSILLVWVGALTGQSDLAKQHLVSAEENLISAQPELHSELVCQIALLKGYAARSGGNLDMSIKLILEALSYLPKDNVFLDCTIQLNLGGNYWLKGDFAALERPLKHTISFVDNPEVEYPALAGAGFLTNAYLQQGKLHQAGILCQNIIDRKGTQAYPAITYVLLEQGELLYEKNDLDSASEVLSKTIEIGKSVDKIVNLVRARQLLARVYCVLGDQEEANLLMKQADELFLQSSPRYQVMHRIEYEYYRVRCLLIQKKMLAALQWANEYKARREVVSNPWATLNELVYAQVLLADEKPDQALPVLKSCEDSARSFEAGGWVLQNLTLQSLCYEASNELESALETLGRAFSLAEPEGYIRTFVDFGLPMKRLLGQAAKANIFPEYVSRLLSAFPAEAGKKAYTITDEISSQQSLVEPLTDQELSILKLMSAGLSHSEIASELYLSINTVKWHSTHIYGKLGVHRRAHAVARARELEII